MIKKIIEESLFEEGAQDIRNNTRGFIFYSVPHRGSQLAAMSKHAAFLLYPSPEVLELSSGQWSILPPLHVPSVSVGVPNPHILLSVVTSTMLPNVTT